MFYSHVEPDSIPSDESLATALVNRVWQRAQQQLGGRREDTSPLAAERLVLALRRTGGDGVDVHYRQGTIRILLRENEYQVGKTYGGEVHVWPARIGRRDVFRQYRENPVLVPSGVFARFLLDFDAHLPEILDLTGGVAETIRRKAVENMKRRMIAWIQQTAAMHQDHSCKNPDGAGYVWIQPL